MQRRRLHAVAGKTRQPVHVFGFVCTALLVSLLSCSQHHGGGGAFLCRFFFLASIRLLTHPSSIHFLPPPLGSSFSVKAGCSLRANTETDGSVEVKDSCILPFDSNSHQLDSKSAFLGSSMQFAANYSITPQPQQWR